MGVVFVQVALDLVLVNSHRSLTIFNAVPDFVVIIQLLLRLYTPTSLVLAGTRVCHRKHLSEYERLRETDLLETAELTAYIL